MFRDGCKCACKGIRSCAICVPSLATDTESNQSSLIYNESSNRCFVYCTFCGDFVRLNDSNRKFFDNFLVNSIDSHHLHDCLKNNICGELSFHIRGMRPFILI